MTFLLLGIAIVAEVAGTSLLRATEGFSRPLPTVGCLSAYLVAFYTLALALQRGLQVGIAYALWAGIGTALIAAIGVAVLGEPLSATKVVGLGLVVAGVVVLNLSGAH